MHHKRIHSYQKSLQKLRNIVSETLRSSGQGRQIEFDNQMRRAIRHIQIIKRNVPSGEKGDLAMVETYRLYDRLQRLSEYPTYFVDNTRKNPGRVASDRGRDYTNARPASVRWDVASMMAEPMTGEDRNWWRPPPRPAPVKHYTREELENEYPAFTVSKKRKDDAWFSIWGVQTDAHGHERGCDESWHGYGL